MAVAVRLSRKLIKTLGDEAAEDMVAWMDSVERNRAELREISDLAFARIDARFQKVDARFKETDARFEARLSQEIGRLEAKIDQRFADLIKWSFVFWTGSCLMMLGMTFAILRQLR